MKKYVKGYDSFRDGEAMNEEFLGKLMGALKKGLGNLYNKMKQQVAAVEGGKEVEQIYQKYLAQLQTQFAKYPDLELNINATEDEMTAKTAAPNQQAPTVDQAASKRKLDAFKKVKAQLDAVVKKTKDTAIAEMNRVLQKYGGAVQNPKLGIIINAKKDQFELDYVNAQLNYLENIGDKSMVATLNKQAQDLSKKVEGDMANIDKAVPMELKEGDKVIYIIDPKKKPEWDKLTDDEKKKPAEGKAASLVGIGDLMKIDGDKYTVKDKDGKEIEKAGADILGKPEATEDGGAIEYKAGENVIYKRDKFGNGGQEKWDAIPEEERANPDSEKVKELIDAEQIGIKAIDSVEGDKITFKAEDGTEIEKTLGDILAKIGAEEIKQDEDEDNKVLDEIKADPEKRKKVANYATWLKTADEAKVKELDDLMK
jgi:hypothetical protein